MDFGDAPPRVLESGPLRIGPVYVAFATDRLEVVLASDIEAADLKAAGDPYRSLPMGRPQLVAAKPPVDAEERNKLLFEALGGRDLQVQPRYYVPYDAQAGEIKRHAQTLAALRTHHPEGSALVAAVENNLHTTEDRLRWLPVRFRRGFWTALIDADSARPVAYLPIDPY